MSLGLALPAAAQNYYLTASGKTMASVSIYSIDGRQVVPAQNVNGNTYDKQFASWLVPGICVVKILYTDHSEEARKVSIY